MSEERDVIRGKLKQIVFRNDDNGYTVARFIVDDLQQRQVTITGISAGVQRGCADGVKRQLCRSSPLRDAVSGRDLPPRYAG